MVALQWQGRCLKHRQFGEAGMTLTRRDSLALALGAATLAAGCRAGGDQPKLEARKYGTWGFDPKGMDRSVQPGDDFFRYSAGKAFDELKIPPDRASWGPA